MNLLMRSDAMRHDEKMTHSSPHTPVPLNLHVLARELLDEARESKPGRSAKTLVGGRDATLRHTVVALRADAQLADHESPGEATLYVIEGRVSLTVDNLATEVTEGEILEISQVRHGLTAHEDSVVMLSIAAHTRPAHQ